MSEPQYYTVARMMNEGGTVKSVSADLGLSVNSIYSSLAYARRSGVSAPRLKTGVRPGQRTGKRITVGKETLRALIPAAEKRGMTARELGQLIVETVVTGDLVDAVLDDGDTHE